MIASSTRRVEGNQNQSGDTTRMHIQIISVGIVAIHMLSSTKTYVLPLYGIEGLEVTNLTDIGEYRTYVKFMMLSISIIHNLPSVHIVPTPV